MLAVGLFVVVITIFAQNTVWAGTQYGTISRGQTKGWFMNPNDTLVVYYRTDGRPCTLSWMNNWFYWWSNQSFSTINVYSSAGYGRTNYWVYVDSLAPYFRSLQLNFSSVGGLYTFVIKNYKGGELATLRIQ